MCFVQSFVFAWSFSYLEYIWFYLNISFLFFSYHISLFSYDLLTYTDKHNFTKFKRPWSIIPRGRMMGHRSGRTPDHCRRCLRPLGRLPLLWPFLLGRQCIHWIERNGSRCIRLLVLLLSSCSLVHLWSLMRLRCTLERFLPSLGYFRRQARNQRGMHDRFRF